MSYQPGVWKVVCAQCGFDKKSDQVKQRWDGPWVCADTCWEPRHILDFFTAPPPEKTIPWSQKVDEDYVLKKPAGSGTLNIPASLTETIFLLNHIQGAPFTIVDLPSADDPAFCLASVTYIITNNNLVHPITVFHDSSTTGFFPADAATRQIIVGATARFRNIPSQNYWIREA